jgi:hypothetical protein
MATALKNYSQVQIEETLAKALAELTGAAFTVNIRKMEAIGTGIYDENYVELKLKSNFSTLFERFHEKEAAEKISV